MKMFCTEDQGQTSHRFNPERLFSPFGVSRKAKNIFLLCVLCASVVNPQKEGAEPRGSARLEEDASVLDAG
jgi:hypothetical protein